LLTLAKRIGLPMNPAAQRCLTVRLETGEVVRVPSGVDASAAFHHEDRTSSSPTAPTSLNSRQSFG